MLYPRKRKSDYALICKTGVCLFLKLIYFGVSVRGYACTTPSVKAKGQLVGVGFSFLLVESQGLNSGLQRGGKHLHTLTLLAIS